MAQIAVLCAAQPASNPGMASVDLAVQGLVQRHRLPATVRFLVLYRTQELGAGQAEDEDVLSRQGLPIHYEICRERPELLAQAQAILFWGDFLHAYEYYQQVVQILVRIGAAPDTDQARLLVDRCVFLADQEPSTLARCIAYGGSTIFNQVRQEVDTHYQNLRATFTRGARSLYMRDVYSALQVAALRRQYERAHLGTDCSLLLRPEDIASLPRTEWSAGASASAGAVGVFFGRSAVDAKLLGKFARDLCRRLDRSAEWLPWGHAAFEAEGQRAARSFRAMRVPKGRGTPTVGDLYALLGSYGMVLSDTYHVCVNAWRLGVPAICIGQAVTKAAFSISAGPGYAWRDKRQTFYFMYDAMPFYVYAEEIADRSWRDRRLYNLYRTAHEPQIAQAIVRRIHSHRDACEAMLLGDLRALVGG